MKKLTLKGKGLNATIRLEAITNVYINGSDIVIEYYNNGTHGYDVVLPLECFDFEMVQNSIIQAINEIIESI